MGCELLELVGNCLVAGRLAVLPYLAAGWMSSGGAAGILLGSWLAGCLAAGWAGWLNCGSGA